MTEEESARKKVNFFILNTAPKPICDVKFQEQPFYNSICNLMRPVAVYCAKTIKRGLEQTKEYSLFDVEFFLPEHIVRVINEKDKNILLQVRFGKEVPGMSELLDGLPEPIQISVNDLFKGTLKDSPIHFECGAVLLLNNKTNRIKIVWPHCKTPYYMIIDIVELVTVEYLVEKVKFLNKEHSMTLNTKARVMELLKNKTKNSDVEFSDSPTLKLSLLCPITKLKIKLPTRSSKCSHLQCFDLHSLFSMNKIKPTWKCPVCNIRLLFRELVIDSFFLNIINSLYLPENCFQIMVLQNGNWKPYIEPKKEYLHYQSKSDIEHSKNTSFIEPKKENLDDQSESDIERSKNTSFIEPKKENLDYKSESDMEHSKNTSFIKPKKENLDDQSESDMEHSKNISFIEPKKENLDD